jgi:integrase
VSPPATAAPASGDAAQAQSEQPRADFASNRSTISAGDPTTPSGACAPKPPVITEPDAAMIEVWRTASDLDVKLEPDSLFSKCVSSHVARRKENNPGVQVSSIVYPARLWMALMGDRPMSAYSHLDLQRFVDRAKHVPPNFEKRFPGKSIAEIVAENQQFKFGAPKRKTVSDTWVATLKGIFSRHARQTQIRSPFSGVTVELPRVLKKPDKHPAPPLAVTNAAFRIGSKSANEVDALMPLLAYATGRRLGLLTYLQGSSFRVDQETGVVFAKVAQTINTPDGLVLTPYKTDESASEFVVPDYVVRTGFVTWAASRGNGFVFASAQRAQDPADMVSKRVNKLLERARAEVGESAKGTAHGWRGEAEDRFDAHSVADGASRLQVGHALDDVHEKYKSGKLPAPEAGKIFKAPPCRGIDLSPFDGLDFSRFDREI